jgi:hypothetical protein
MNENNAKLQQNITTIFKFLKKIFKYLPKGAKLPKKSQIAKNQNFDMVEYLDECGENIWKS